MRNIERLLEKAQNNNTIRQVWKIRYYTAALIAQKGIQILILPFLLTVFSRSDYANYVIFYSVVQVFGTIIGLGVPTAMVPFWQSDNDTDQLVAQSIRFTLINTTVLGIIGIIYSLFYNPLLIQGYYLSDVAWLFMIFVTIYNINLIALGYARSSGRELIYFCASLVGASALLLGLYIAKFVAHQTLIQLIMIQMISLLCTIFVLFGKQFGKILSRMFTKKNELKLLFDTARPLAVNSLILLTVMNIDKWMAKLFFADDLFSQYTIDYQSAFAIMFVPAAIGTYLGPKIKPDSSSYDANETNRDINSARILTFFGSTAMSVVMYIYAFTFNLQLSAGYWILVLALIVEGQNSITSLQVMARKRFSRLLSITMLGLIIYVVALTVAGTLVSTTLLYFALLINALVMPALLCQGSYRRSLLGSVEPDRDCNNIKTASEE